MAGRGIETHKFLVQRRQPRWVQHRLQSPRDQLAMDLDGFTQQLVLSPIRFQGC